MKLTKRKGFNFFRSYFDVYNELSSDKEKVAFIDALLNRQFLGEIPKNLTGMAKFAYISQTNSIDSQVKGWETKTGLCLSPPSVGATEPPTEGATHGGQTTPTLQLQEKGKEKEKGKGKLQYINASGFSFRKSLESLGIKKELTSDFLKNRKLKRLANTETAFKNLKIEIEKTEMDVNELFEIVVSKGWGSFKNSWFEKEKNFSGKKEKKITAAQALREKYGINNI
tara:strand:- start:4108 stop:4785 length:678 start_codon:yes stop_codon:yes gene_type:complete